MEREGTGYDLMYDVQLSQGRTVPEAKEGADSVTVTVRRRILKPAVIKLLADADARFQLRRRERITLGLLAMSEGLTARQLSTALELEDGESLKSWLGRLPELGVLGTSGRTQGMRYYVDPVLLRASGLEGKTTLVRIEPHRLEALVLEDLARYPGASSSEVNRRIAPEIGIRAVRSALERLESKGEVRHEGEKRWRRYWTVKTN
jgi:ATP-dependent DNA helicase RecG